MLHYEFTKTFVNQNLLLHSSSYFYSIFNGKNRKKCLHTVRIKEGYSKCRITTALPEKWQNTAHVSVKTWPVLGTEEAAVTELFLLLLLLFCKDVD